MNKEIEQLVELAKEYFEYELLVGGVEPHRWSYIASQHIEGMTIHVYVNGESVDNGAVKIDEVEVNFYSGKIQFPYSFTISDLVAIWEKGGRYLKTLNIQKADLKEKRRLEKQKEIAKTDEEIEKLKKKQEQLQKEIDEC